ncbi:MAG: hypothetical protein ONB46_25795 [candidate division KSB1 bacterium]|nr:hypothetical protein [candidate division KSB1 bacterium]MDZ7369328.1 hypothetical protein [candidate division KSB1 bacterium]MDZ7407370.1 hypothetical protein [candidate division KSB1 bacterium]
MSCRWKMSRKHCPKQVDFKLFSHLQNPPTQKKLARKSFLLLCSWLQQATPLSLQVITKKGSSWLTAEASIVKESRSVAEKSISEKTEIRKKQLIVIGFPQSRVSGQAARAGKPHAGYAGI